ncbi:MAG TPA: hypothetical protein VM821_07120 [Abditibacteriaceae bacterium]|nr:hypothetical protein [Abditibacteriaceae bacterium]
MTILFVCSGNTCRSPLAVAAWRSLDDAGASQSEASQGETVGEAATAIEVASAGLAAGHGSAATRYAQQIAHRWKVDLSAHRSRLLRQRLARESDLIVAMTQEQAQSVCAQFGLPSHRVRVLGEFADHRVLESPSPHSEERRLAALLNEETAFENGDAHDIDDPFGASLEAYESCAARIRLSVKGLRRALREGEVAL